MPISDDSSAQSALAEAAQSEARYDWLSAAGLYQKTLDQSSLNGACQENARVTEHLARSYFRSAFQAETREEFLRRMRLSGESYERAASWYKGHGQEAQWKRLTARVFFANFWMTEDAQQRRDFTEKSILAVQDSIRILELLGSARNLAEARRDLLTYFHDAEVLGKDWNSIRERSEEALEVGQKAIDTFTALGDIEATLECLYATFGLFGTFTCVAEPQKLEELRKKGMEVTDQVIGIQEKIGTPYAASLANGTRARAADFSEDQPAKVVDLCEAAIRNLQYTRDSNLMGSISALASNAALWAGYVEEDAEKRREFFEKGTRFGETAVEHLTISEHGSLLDSAYSDWAENYLYLATLVDVSASDKEAHLDKAIKTARRGIPYARRSMSDSIHTLSKAMYSQAGLSGDPGEKRRLLKEALSLREEFVRTQYLLRGPLAWMTGVGLNYLALLKAELSILEQDPEQKTALLISAVRDMQNCIEVCNKWTAYPPWVLSLAVYEEWYGDTLLKLYENTGESEALQQALRIYENAIGHLDKLGQIGQGATVQWKLAKLHDSTRDYKTASQSFTNAANDYRLAAEKNPTLFSTYKELGSYMDAWALIEDARAYHEKEDYLPAAERYAKAATILRETTTRNQLSSHYAACSLLERAEALSRDDREELSVETFASAIRAFQETRTNFEVELEKNPDAPDAKEFKDWLEITNGREQYSVARLELEEARVLDKNGEEEASSRKYRDASQKFKMLLTGAPTEQSKRELETLMLFCEAWAKMKRAEAEASPQLYVEATASFLNAKECATSKKFRLLALANASMCKALEAGAMFRLTRDIQLYSEIKKRLEAAADHYEQAAFKNAAEWTRATQTMFDALAYAATAEVEIEPTKKNEFYHLAEKHFEMASRLYRQAGFQARSDEVLKHLKRVHQEKEILPTPIEVLAKNPAVRGAVVNPASLTRDQAVGLEKLEEANVVGTLGLRQQEVEVGSEVNVDLEVANVGRNAAMLLKLEDLVPEGFELDRLSSSVRFEDSYVDLKGKRLEHLKTHQIKATLRPIRVGTSELKPSLFYVDEKGNHRSYKFPPITVIVPEPSAPGKSLSKAFEAIAPTVSPSEAFLFETERVRGVFQLLVKEFIDDYMVKRLSLEQAGWRNLTMMVKALKIPKSQIYGEARYGHTFGKPLEKLVKAGIVEYRTFPGKGRGGSVMKVRVSYDREPVKRLVEKLALKPLDLAR